MRSVRCLKLKSEKIKKNILHFATSHHDSYTEKRSQSGRIAGLLSIDEIKTKYEEGQLHGITFSVNVNILQIYDKSHALIYQYDVLHGRERVGGGDDGDGNLKNVLQSKYEITWHVDRYTVNEFVQSDAIKQYETVRSLVQNVNDHTTAQCV